MCLIYKYSHICYCNFVPTNREATMYPGSTTTDDICRLAAADITCGVRTIPHVAGINFAYEWRPAKLESARAGDVATLVQQRVIRTIERANVIKPVLEIEVTAECSGNAWSMVIKVKVTQTRSSAPPP
jgi:hypothetical protein